MMWAQCSVIWFMPQSHPTKGPVRFLSPVRFLARKAEWSARRNFTSVLFPWSHQATGIVRLWHVCILMVWLNNSKDPTGIPCSYPTGPVRGPCVTHKGAVRRPYGQVREFDTTIIGKNPVRAYGRTGPVRAPYGPRTGCSRAVYNL